MPLETGQRHEEFPGTAADCLKLVRLIVEVGFVWRVRSGFAEQQRADVEAVDFLFWKLSTCEAGDRR